MQPSSATAGEEQIEKDDVDVYVSPRRFVGHTPGPKVTKQRVFEDNQRRKNSAKKDDVGLSIESVKYHADKSGEDANQYVNENMARNNCISMVVLYANYLLALVGLVIAGISVWVAANSRNGGIAAFTFVAAILLKAPVALGICLLIAALASILTGLVFGARHVSPSIVEGLQLERRNAYLGFQAIATLSIALYAMVLFSAIHPLHQINREGITPRRWREMATKHPDRVCSYQVENDCSGLGIHSCSSASAIRNPICPGHFCKDTCKVGSLRPPSNLTTCRGCVNSFKSPEPLKACRAAEAKRKSQGSCIARLKGDLRRYFVIVTVASSIGMGLMLLVAILGTLSPVLSTKM